MPKNLNSVYSSNATKPELQALCNRHGLGDVDEQGKQLSVAELKKKLDQFAARGSNIMPSLAFDEQGRDSANGLELRTNTELVGNATNSTEANEAEEPNALVEEIDGPATAANPPVLSVDSSIVVDEQKPDEHNGREKATYEVEESEAVADEHRKVTTDGQPVPDDDPGFSPQGPDTESPKIPETDLRSIGEKFGVNLNSVMAEPSESAASTMHGEAVGTIELHPAPIGPFYLQLQARNLGYYLSRGIIYPLALEPDQEWNAERPQDSLSDFPHFLPILPGHLADFSDKHVLIELLLLPAETTRLLKAGGYHALREPLPVSRIRRVYFSSLEALTNFKANANLYDNYFFPEKICEVINASKVPLVGEVFEAAAEAVAAPDNAWALRMRQFDKQLGLFAYLKHAPLLRANVEGNVQDFSAEFLVGLHLLNNSLEPVAEVNKWVMSGLLRLDTQPATTAGQLLFAAIVGAIYAEEEVSFSWALNLLRRVEGQCADLFDRPPADMVQLRAAQAQLDLLRLDKTNFQKVLLAIAQSDGSGASVPKVPFAALVLLAKFPGRARTVIDKQSVLAYLARSADQGKLKAPALDQLLAVLGLYYGYARLTRQDPNLDIKNPALAAAARPLHRLRFDIGWLADQIIVETVFRFVVEGKPIQDALAYLHPDRTAKNVIQLPQRFFPLAEGTGGGQFALAAAIVVAAPAVVPMVGDGEHSAAVYQGIIRKMMGVFDPTFFNTVMVATFTQAEREVLRRLQSEKKNVR